MNLANSSFEEIIDRISDAFVALDKNWCYTYVNNKAGQIFDRDPTQLVGKHIWTEFPEGVGKPFHKAYEKAMQNQKYIYLQEYYDPYDLWFENHIYPSPNGLSIYFRDITESKKLEETLTINEKIYRTLTDNAPVAIFQTNNNGDCVFVNKEWLAYSGRQYTESIGKGWTNAIHPVDSERVWNEWSTAVDSGLDFYSEFRFVDLNNKVSWLSARAVKMLDDDKNIIGYVGMAIDITERKNAALALQESEEKFRLFADRSIEGIMLRRNTRITYVNPTYCKITGYSESDFLNFTRKEQFNLIHPDDRKKVKERLAKNDKGEELSEMAEVRLIKKNGEIIWVKGNSKKVVISGNEYMMGMALEITGQKKQNDKLVKSMQRNTAFLKAMPDVIFVINKDGVFTDYNNPYGSETLTAPETFLQKTVFEVLPPKLAEETMQNLKLVFEKGESPVHQYQLAYPDGNRHFEGRYAKINENEVLVIVRDITERKKADEELIDSEIKYRTLTESSPDYIMRYDKEHRHSYMNKAALDISGYKEEDVIGKTHLEAGYDPELSTFWEEKIDHVFKTGGTVQEQFSWQSANGIVYLDWRLSPELDEHGKVRSVLGVSRDITEIKKAEKRIIQLNTELEQRVKERTAELEIANENLQELNELFVGNEITIYELKEELRKLKKILNDTNNID